MLIFSIPSSAKILFKKENALLIFIFCLSLFTVHRSHVYCQVPTVQDCLGAIPICQEAYIEYDVYTGSGHYPNEIYNRMGDCTQDCPGSCLDGEMNSVWYVITVQNEGFLRFAIDPGGDEDVDWALYDLTDHSCADIYSNYNPVQKSCNAYGYAPNGRTGISTEEGGTSDCSHCGGYGTYPWNSDLFVTAGSIYVLVVEDWTGTGDGFTLNFGGSTASILDESPPRLDTVYTADLSCGATELGFAFSERVQCDLLDASDILFSGPSGTITILDVQGGACLAGGEMERQFTLLLDRPLVSNGEYSLQLLEGNDVEDGCDNVAASDTLVFTLDLGAPVVVDTGIVITHAYEGMNNGSITGLAVSGNEPLSFRWYDHFNDTIGTGIDLNNVYAGNYFLEITDTSGCETNVGPYMVDLIENVADPRFNATGILAVIPNPNRGIFIVHVSEDVVNLTVSSLTGNVLITIPCPATKGGSVHADLSYYGPGIYLLQAKTKNGYSYLRMVQVL